MKSAPDYSRRRLVGPRSGPLLGPGALPGPLPGPLGGPAPRRPPDSAPSSSAPSTPAASPHARRAAADDWTRAACLAFAFATLYALAVVALRLPAWQADHRDAFRIALLLHVELAVFAWLTLTMAGQWARSLGPGAWRWPLRAGVAGTVLLAAAPLAGGRPVMADYFPWLAGNPLFAVGFALIAGGVLALAVQRLLTPIASLVFPHPRPSPASGRGEFRESLGDFHVHADAALRLAAWPAVFAALAALSAGLAGADGPDVAWAAGHTLLFAHVAMLCHEWTVHAGADAGRAARAVRGLAAAGVLLALLPFVWAPGTAAFRGAYSAAMIGVLWLPPLYVALGLRRATLGAQPPVSRLVLALSLPLFVLGALLGIAIALAGTPTTLITAHYHAAMGAIAISRMGIAYLHTGRLAADPARWPALRGQLAVYAGALVLLTGGLTLAAVDGAPRKTSAAEFVAKGAWYRAGMTVAGVGGTLAMAGTVWLLVNLLRPAGRPRPQRRLPLAAKGVAHES